MSVFNTEPSSGKTLGNAFERIIVVCLLLLLSFNFANAQNLAITNARIIDGTGLFIERGTILIVNGRLHSVSNGRQTPPTDVQTIDARGMTVLPGFIDAHRHLIKGDAQLWFKEQATTRMQELLDAGFTTVMSGGDELPGILDLQKLVNQGHVNGPRIISTGMIHLRTYATPKAARERVQVLAKAGVEFVKIWIGSTPLDKEKTLIAAIVDEARHRAVKVMAHATSVLTMTTAVEAGVTKLVHTPHGSFMNEADAQLLADAHVENLSTVGFGVPVFGVFNNDNTPTFRNGKPWPYSIPNGKGRGREAGEKIVNARTLWDADVTYGFGTDTDFHPQEGLYHELKTLNLMFSPSDILKMMGPNTAAFIDREDDLGTLAPGKLADLVIVDGDPLDLIFDLLKVKLVIKGGNVVIDHR